MTSHKRLIVVERTPSIHGIRFYFCLGKREFLAAFENSRTQNLNESYHHIVWSLAPKGSHVSPLDTRLAVQVVTLLFNKDVNKCFTNIFHSMDMNITDNMKNQWISIDEQKSKIKTIMKSDECKARRKELKR